MGPRRAPSTASASPDDHDGAIILPRRLRWHALIIAAGVIFGLGGSVTLAQYKITVLEARTETHGTTLRQIREVVCVMCDRPECKEWCRP
jgi:hypothetical protein